MKNEIYWQGVPKANECTGRQDAFLLRLFVIGKQFGGPCLNESEFRVPAIS